MMITLNHSLKNVIIITFTILSSEKLKNIFPHHSMCIIWHLLVFLLLFIFLFVFIENIIYL